MNSIETKKEKTNLIKEIKELESEFKKPGIKSKKTLIEKSILGKEAKVRKIENQLRPTKKEKEDKKEELPQSDQIDKNKPETIDAKKEEKKTEEKEVDWDNNPMIKSEGGKDVPVQEVKEEKKEELPEQTMEKEGEKKQIEYKGESLEEKQQKIEKLWQEVERSRKEYLDKDYANNEVTTRLRNFFGSFLKKDKEGSGFESDKELAEYRAYYDSALLEHKKAKLEFAKFTGASDKELLDIAKLYQAEANVNLADVHDQVKIENQEGKFSGFIREHSQELVERYKKMPLAKKIAIGAAFGLAGVGAIYIGGAAVGIAGSAIAARRAIMGVITGTTVSLGFEARGKKKTAEKIQKERDDLESKMAEMSESDKVKMLEEFINNNIQDADRKIDKIKNKNLRHLAYGVAAGVGVILAPKIMRLFSEETGIGGSVSEHPGGKNIPIGESEGPERLGMTDEEIAEKLRVEEAAPETAAGGAEILETEPVVVEVQKGDSLWKIIGKQLEEKYQNYADLNEAQKTHVIDALKDKVAVDPEKFGLDNIDKLKIGQKIDLSELFQDKQPENLITQVQDLNEDQMRNILDNNQKLRDLVNANPGEELTSEKTAEILEGESKGAEELGMADEEIASASEASNIEEASKVEGASEASETSEESKIEDKVDIDRQTEENTETGEPEIQFESKKSEWLGATLSPEEAHRIIEKSADGFGEQIVKLGSVDAANIPDGQLGVLWKEIKDIKYSNVQSEGSSIAPKYVKDRLDRMMFFSEEKFGSEGIPKPDEKLKDWLVRLIEKNGEDKIKNVFQFVK